MNNAGGSILPNVDAEPAAAALARLREQRWQLRQVRDGVEATGRRLTARPAVSGWRSPAQRAFEDRLAELAGTLQGAWRSLDDALWAVDEAISRVKASL
jgi:hypothetical protein